MFSIHGQFEHLESAGSWFCGRLSWWICWGGKMAYFGRLLARGLDSVNGEGRHSKSWTAPCAHSLKASGLWRCCDSCFKILPLWLPCWDRLWPEISPFSCKLLLPKDLIATGKETKAAPEWREGSPRSLPLLLGGLKCLRNFPSHLMEQIKVSPHLLSVMRWCSYQEAHLWGRTHVFDTLAAALPLPLSP